MRILVLTDEIYPDAIGGVGKSVMNTCRAWAGDDHTVTVLVRRINPLLPSTDQIDGVRIARFDGPPRRSAVYRLYPLWIVWGVSRWLAREAGHYDIIYLHNGLYMLPVRLAGAHRKTPVIFNAHAPLFREIQIGAERGQYGGLAGVAKVIGRLFSTVEGWAVRTADHVVADSHYMLDELRSVHGVRNFEHKSTVITLGIDLADYTPRDRATARQRLALPAGRPLLLTVRRLVGRMGLANLIEAMAAVRHKQPEVLLLIGGTGYLRPQLEQQVHTLGLEESIRFLGFIPEKDLPDYLAAADLFVLPTEQLEGFGLATIEALAAGTPVLGTPVGATPELLRSIDPDLLTRDASPGALATGICTWLGQPERLAVLSAACRQAAETQFDAKRVARQLMALFEQYVPSTHGDSTL